MSNFIKVMLMLSLYFSVGAGHASQELRCKLKYIKEVTCGEQTGSGDAKYDIMAIKLDSEIFKRTNRLFSNFRIFDSTRNEIPFLIRPVLIKKADFTDEFFETKILSLKKLDNNRLEIVVENMAENQDYAKHLPYRIEIKTSSRNFEREVAVYGAHTLDAFGLLGVATKIFDYSEITDLSEKSIPVPEKPFRYYKIVISNFTQTNVSKVRALVKEQKSDGNFRDIVKTFERKEAIRIDEIVLVSKNRYESVLKSEQCEYPIESVSERKDGKSIFIIETQRQPLTEFIIETPSTNFSRSVNCYLSDDGKEWCFLKRALIAKNDIGTLQKSNTKVVFREMRKAFYKLEIVDGDSPPLDISMLRAFGTVYSAEFLMLKETQFPLSLYYGGKKIATPKYDINAVFADLHTTPSVKECKLGQAVTNNQEEALCENRKASSVKECKLGQEIANPEFEPSGDGFLDSKTLFIVIVCAVVVMLGFVLGANLKKIP